MLELSVRNLILNRRVSKLFLLVQHHYFEEKGTLVNGNREFFQVSTNEAIDLINLYFKMDQEQYGE